MQPSTTMKACLSVREENQSIDTDSDPKSEIVNHEYEDEKSATPKATLPMLQAYIADDLVKDNVFCSYVV